MDSRHPAGAFRLTEAERALLEAWRERRAEPARGPLLTADERLLISKWREWEASPSFRPLWVEELRYSLRDAVPDVPLYTGLSDDTGFLVEAPARFLGMLLGGVTGEATAGRGGERASAALFALEGLIRAHTGSRLSGTADPVACARDGLLRWLHTRGGPSGASADGWLIQQDLPRNARHDDAAMLTALAQVATGRRHGTRLYPVNDAGSALAVPLGALAALWSNRDDVVFGLGCDLAALTHGHPHGHVPAGLMAVMVFWLLRGQPLDDSFRRALAYWPDPAAQQLSSAARLGRNRPPGYLPGRTQLDAMGTARSGVQVLATAIRVALACENDVGAALRIAANHSGDTGTTAMLAGQLLGARHGPAAVPANNNFGLRHVVETLVVDATTEFGPQPDESVQWTHRYPLPESQNTVTTRNYRTGLVARPRLVTSGDRFVGAILGCAIGDALGNPVASDSWEEIQAKHGLLRDYVPGGQPAGRLGSDSQLLLFSLEGLIRANVSRRNNGTNDPLRHVQHAYQRWLHTQHLSWSHAAGEFSGVAAEPDGWLVEQRALFQIRNPGRTLMRTLIAFAKGEQTMGTPENPVSDARNSSALTRAAAAALWSDDAGEVFRVGAAMAALTHGNVTAYLSAGALGFLVTRLVRGEPLDTATESIVDHLPGHAGHERVSRRISAALRLARGGPVDPVVLERDLGTGWTAPDALAIGLYAALRSQGDFDTALTTAVNHAGNSATTGALCGALMGAMTGADRIPERWLVDLELCEVIERLAREATLEFGPHPPREPDWFRRYPAT